MRSSEQNFVSTFASEFRIGLVAPLDLTKTVMFVTFTLKKYFSTEYKKLWRD